MKHLCYTISLTGMLFGSLSLAHAASLDEQELLFSYGGEEMVALATGRQKPIRTAPAVTSVVTTEDIHAMGARDLDEVLETVPGLHVIPSPGGYNPLYVMRGIYSEFNPQVLVQIDGIPVTNIFVGNRSQAWGGMPVENIARIEVIRGPGSAVYGADAVSGVINIVTKTAIGMEVNEAGARAGSFATAQGWLLDGTTVGDWTLRYAMQAMRTDGQDRLIEADAQTTFDTLAGTSASRAPGPVNLGRDSLDARLSAEKGPWALHLGYQGRRHGETGAGAAQALDPIGEASADRWNADLNHTRSPNPDWELTTRLSLFQVATEPDLVLFPAGADFTLLGGGPFPQGVIGNPHTYERHARLDFSAFYYGLARHEVRVGTGLHYGDLYKVEETKNYILAPGGIPVPAPLQTVPVSSAFVRPEDRQVIYAFVQDEWKFAPDWTLTSGIRYDHFSDFGDTVNPRLALVWQSGFNWTSKLLYGRAFRPPSFAELYNQNNPVALGNPNLDPETIDTLEAAFVYQDGDRIRSGINLFYYQWHDIIRFTPVSATASIAQNGADQNGYGLEWDLRWKVRSNLGITANYAYQQSEDDVTGQDSGMAPKHQAYVRFDWKLPAGWSLHPQLTWVADRAREPGDTRPPIDDYTLVDATLRYRPSFKGWNGALTVRNLFDEDAREPSPAPGLIPNDLPLAGRSIYAEARYFW